MSQFYVFLRSTRGDKEDFLGISNNNRTNHDSHFQVRLIVISQSDIQFAGRKLEMFCILWSCFLIVVFISFFIYRLIVNFE